VSSLILPFDTTPAYFIDHTGTDRGDPPLGNSLNAASVSTPLDPKAAPKGPSADLTIATRFHETIGLALDHEKRLAYVSDLGGSLWVVNLETKDKRALVRDRGNYTGIALVKTSKRRSIPSSSL
jgi:hypothetical protein